MTHLVLWKVSTDVSMKLHGVTTLKTGVLTHRQNLDSHTHIMMDIGKICVLNTEANNDVACYRQ